MSSSRVRLVLAALLLAASVPLGSGSMAAAAPGPVPFSSIVPAPASAIQTSGVTYTLPSSVAISTDVQGIGEQLAVTLRKSTGYAIPVHTPPAADGIQLSLSGAPASVGDQGYQLDVTANGVSERCNGQGQPCGRVVRRCADVAAALPAAGAGEHRDRRAVEADRREGGRPAAVRVQERDARCGAALLQRCSGEAVHR